MDLRVSLIVLLISGIVVMAYAMYKLLKELR